QQDCGCNNHRYSLFSQRMRNLCACWRRLCYGCMVHDKHRAQQTHSQRHYKRYRHQSVSTYPVLLDSIKRQRKPDTGAHQCRNRIPKSQMHQKHSDHSL
ncbi:hypothetical protein H4S06_006935, partial [Coemansia sp. BCRC 34490]